MDDRKDPNQGEGDRESDRRYREHLDDFISRGKVRRAAQGAERYVEKDPEGAARAERTARRGPHGYFHIVEDILARGKSIYDRVKARVTAATRKR